MTSVYEKRTILPVALLLAGSLLAGCANNMELEPSGDMPENGWSRFWALGDWKQRPEPYKNQVERVSMQYKVGFAPGNAELNQNDLGMLHGFLREHQVSGTDVISIDGPTTVTEGRNSLTTARIAKIMEELGRAGLQASVSPANSASQAMSSDELLLTVSRHIVLSPECDTEDPEVGDRPTYHWTCATTSNLGAMVVNPQDLAQGRTPGPAEAEPAASAVQRYRKGEITPLIDVSTGNI